MRRMLGELALFVHFAEARRGMDDNKWREERIKRLAEAVEALSGGRIIGDHAERLTKLIISYAESRTERRKKRIENLAEEVGISKEEVWGVVKRVLSGEDPYVYCLARDCARDVVVRKFVAPALELIMLDKALNDSNEFDREEALLIFGEMYATAVAGDGSVGPRGIRLAVGGELGGGAALLRLATLLLLKELLSEELKFDVRAYVRNNGLYDIAAYGENAARFMRLLAVSAPSAGGEYLSPKFDEFVEAAKVEVWLDENSIRETEGGNVAADLTISVSGVAVKYNVYLLKDTILLQFTSTDRGRAELAARLLRHAGVSAEVKREGNRDVWYVRVHTDMLAAGREELRDALAEFVRKAVENEKKAERWLKKLEEGYMLMEGWPKFHVGLTHSGALRVKFASPNPDSIQQVAQRFRDMGLVEDVHFTVKMPEEGRDDYVSILKEGLAYAAWLSVYGSETQQELAARFVELILKRAEKAGKEVYEKAKEIVEKGKAWGSLTLERFEKGVVKVIGGGAEIEESRSGKKLLRIRITAEVNGIKSDYTITYGRYRRNNATEGFAIARADAPGGREADAERYSALIKALTDKEPKVYQKSDGKIKIACHEGHLEGFMSYKELAHTIKRWLEETSRRRPTH